VSPLPADIEPERDPPEPHIRLLPSAFTAAAGGPPASPEAAYRAILETAIDAIMTIDAEGRIVAHNAAACHMFGYGSDDLLGGHMARLVPADDRSALISTITAYVADASRGAPASGLEMDALRADGTTFPVHLAIGGMVPLKSPEIKLVLERLVEKGKIMVKRAYADWNRYAEYKRPFHEHAIELIDVPQSRYSGKNSADIRMVVDAMDLAYAKQHVDTFALVSGDSDFSPLVSKLRENDRYVIGLGVKSSSSELLVGNCDEFIFYEDLIRESKKTTALRGLPEKKAEAFAQLIEAIQALQRENKDTLWGSMVKQTMIRKNPAFNESYYGYSTFSKLLEEAAKQKILTLERDAKSGTYIITSIEADRAA